LHASNDMEEKQSNQSKDIDQKTGKRINNLMSMLFIFLILFLFTLSMLVYFQFYQGYGKWRFTLLHKSNDTTLLLSIKSTLPDSSLSPKKQIKGATKDSSKSIIDSIHSKNTPILPNIVDSIATGTVYEVQIGTFENYELKKYNAVFNNLHEEKTGNRTKLTLGRFYSGKEANEFKRDMVKLGIKDAWVVKKVNGVRK